MELFLLGTAQDGGVPHAGCSCSNCWEQKRMAASIALVENDEAIIIDATPDFRHQYHSLQEWTSFSLKAIYLTHAHWGHYGGLMQLGKEAWNSSKMPVYLSESFHKFLRNNQPFASLIDNGNIEPRILKPSISTTDGIAPISIPHRSEYSDNFAFRFKLNGRNVVYMPDADGLDPEFKRQALTSDLAIIDGTFYDATELPDREFEEISHPLISETSREFADIASRIVYTHFNHTNPVLKSNDPRVQELSTRGFRFAKDGDVIS